MLREAPVRWNRSCIGSRRGISQQFLSSLRLGTRVIVALGLLTCFGAQGLWAAKRAGIHMHRAAVQPSKAIVAVNQAQQFQVTDTQGRTVDVNWRVSGLGCTDSSCGTIDEQGVYRPPAVLPQPPVVTLEGVLVSDPRRSVLKQVQLQAAVTVTVSPASAQVTTGSTQQFTASVTGSGDQIVIWSISGTGCAGLACGSISGSGLYTAPPTAPNPATVTVRADSLADPAVSATATVTVVAPLPITVTISPTSATVSPGSQQQLGKVRKTTKTKHGEHCK